MSDLLITEYPDFVKNLEPRYRSIKGSFHPSFTPLLWTGPRAPWVDRLGELGEATVDQ